VELLTRRPRPEAIGEVSETARTTAQDAAGGCGERPATQLDPAPGTATRELRAAALAIGNELLSGKVTDLNLAYAIKELRALGAELACALVVPDTFEAIGDGLRYALAHADHVFTTGGVGPTHDDLTVPAIAKALGRDLVRDPGLEAAIRAWYGKHTNDEVLRMADVPRGAVLEKDERFFLPLAGIAVDQKSVFWFPGEPTHFKRQFDRWKARFRGTRPFVLAELFLDVDEGEIAHDLRAVEDAHGVAIGSYPKYDQDAAAAGYRVLVTIESKERAAVEAARDDLIGRLRPGRLLRTRTS